MQIQQKIWDGVWQKDKQDAWIIFWKIPYAEMT